MPQPPQQSPQSDPPGWYPDPAGVAGRHRHWDGQQWRPEVTFDPTAPLPDQPGQARPDGARGPGSGRGPSRTAIGLVVAAGAVLVALAVVLVLVVPQMLGGPRPVEPTPPPDHSSGPVTPPSPGGDESAQLNCAGGNQVSIDTRATTYASTGVTISVPDDWGFRLEKSQWTWLDDQAAWGKAFTEDDERYIVAAVLGGLAQRNGFVDPEQATADLITCLNRYGIYNDKDYPQQEMSSAAVTVGGMTGWKRAVEFTDSPGTAHPTSLVTVIVLDSGQPTRLASLVTFAPAGHAASQQAVEQITASLTKQ